MQQDVTKEKLVELSEKALAIEEEIISEEKKYLEALLNDLPLSILKTIRKRIKDLCRKERLFNGAIDCRLDSEH